MKSTALTLAIAMAIAVLAGSAEAATINWGDITSPSSTVVYTDVTEDNGEATTLFAPEATGPTVGADMLFFNPVGFQSQSSGGMADLIDSSLSTVVRAKPGFSIDELVVNEFGDYSLGGLTDGEALASVGAAFFWTITSVDGAPVAVPTQTSQLSVSDGGYYERPADDGTATPWTGEVVLDVAALAAQYNLTGDVTGVRLRFDNTLQTAADAVSTAFIKKKGLEITVTTTGEIPEPAAAGMALLAGLFGFARRR